MISSGQQKTIEEIQKGQNFPYKVDPLVKIDKIIIPHEYRIKAQVYIEKLVEPYTIAINPVWKSPRDDGIIGEIVMNKDWNFNEEDDDWEKEKVVIFLHGGAYCVGNINYCREMVSELSKASGARVLAIEYRLAPQQPFPAGLCDTLATYLYLTNPPDDSGFKPYKPSQIVMCGDSAGGALSISLGLALRDLGLPPPAGIVGWVSIM
jgi:acetyl esterase/lipase